MMTYTYDGMISFFVLVLYFTISCRILYLHAKMFTIALAANDGFIFAKSSSSSSSPPHFLSSRSRLCRSHSVRNDSPPFRLCGKKSVVISCSASNEDKENPSSSTSSLTLLPKDSADALYRYRKVMSVLFALGGALHVPDVFGAGPLANANNVDSFQQLPLLAKLVTVLWSVGGPATALLASQNAPIADFMVSFVASCEIIVGVDFNEGFGVEIPAPIVFAQCVNVASAVGLRLWEKREKEGKTEREKR